MPEMLIGGEWRQATAHAELEVVNPATEEVVDTVPAGSPEDVELAVATATARVRRLVADRRREARGDPRAGRRSDPRAREGARGDADLRAGQAAGRGDRRGQPSRATACASTPRRRRRSAGAYQELPSDVRAGVRDGDPPADRRVRGDHAVQLPADAARDEGRAGAGRRQHGRRQAGGDDAAGDARGRAAVLRGGRARRRAERRHGPRVGDRRRARLPSRTCAGSRSPARPRSAATSPGSPRPTSSGCRSSSAARIR